MQAQLQFVERKRAADWDDQFAIENESLLRQPGEGSGNIRKITREWLPGLRLQVNLLTVTKRNTAKAVPLRLVLPLRPFRNRVHEQRLHRRVRNGNRQAHTGNASTVPTFFTELPMSSMRYTDVYLLSANRADKLERH